MVDAQPAPTGTYRPRDDDERSDAFFDAIMGLLDGSLQVEARTELTDGGRVTTYRVTEPPK